MTYEVPLERGKIREFARATNSRNPAFDGDDAVIPPTFLTTAALWWEPRAHDPMRAVSIDVRRLLHGEEEYVFHGPPPRAGQRLTVDSRLDDQWEKEGRRGGTMRFFRFVREFRDSAGNLVAEQRTTLVETGKPPSKDS